jgi:membrane protease YdiL (CAAX protease family)
VSVRVDVAGGLDRDDALGSVVLVVGCVVLALRPLSSVSADPRVVLFGATYATIALASIAVPAERGRSHLSRAWALALGTAAVVAVTGVTGPSVASPWGAAALPLSVVAAVAEEALFRRVAYARFARFARFGAVVAVAGSALLFGLVHVPAYGLAALPVDLGAGLVFGWQRWASGTWTVPAATHAFANVLVVLR